MIASLRHLLRNCDNIPGNHIPIIFLFDFRKTLFHGRFCLNGAAQDLQVVLDAPAAEVYISIYDDTGALRSTFNTEAMPTGRGAVEWEGLDMAGNPLPDGNYWFEVSAVDTAGEEVEAYTLSSGTVNGVAFENGEAMLVVNGLLMNIDSVIEVSQPEG